MGMRRWEYDLGDIVFTGSIIVATGLIMREVRAHAQNAEDMAVEQYRLREQNERLLTTIQGLSADIDRLTAAVAAFVRDNGKSPLSKATRGSKGTASTSSKKTDATGNAAESGAKKGRPRARKSTTGSESSAL